EDRDNRNDDQQFDERKTPADIARLHPAVIIPSEHHMSTRQRPLTGASPDTPRVQWRGGLNRRLRPAEALTIESKPIEATNPALPGREHRARVVDPTRASLWLFGGGDPVDPISARHGRNVRPQRPRFGGGCQGLPQICRNPWFRFRSGRRYLQRDEVAWLCARSFAKLPIHFEPVAFLAVWLERRSKGSAIDRPFDYCHTARGELRTGLLWQVKKRPGAGLRGRRRPEESRPEPDLRSSFGHFCHKTTSRMTFLPVTLYASRIRHFMLFAGILEVAARTGIEPVFQP